jgi:hypothetical protein
MRERTLPALARTQPFYYDETEWSFHEQDLTSVKHTAKIELKQQEDEKFPTVVMTFKTEDNVIILRMAVYDFKALNELFKRASFRLD